MNDLEESDDFGAFWRYLEKASELTIEQDHWSTFRENIQSMLIGHRFYLLLAMVFIRFGPFLE